MLQGFDANRSDINEFHQRVADRNIQDIENRQDEIQHAKNGFIGMLAGVLVGALVGWIFLSPSDSGQKKHIIPTIRRPVKAFKVQPNDPGGMEIDNQDREIYHIVDNKPKEIKEVKIREQAVKPQLVIENAIETPDDMESLVESIEEDSSLNNEDTKIIENTNDTIKIAQTNLLEINTNSKDKVVIPEKIEQIDVKLQKTINQDKSTPKAKETTENKIIKVEAKTIETPKSVKGSWYTQIIASSSRSAVESLWKKLSSKHTFLKEYYHEIEEITSATGNTLYRLKVGSFKTRKEAENLSSKLKQNNIGSIIKQN